MYFNQGRLSKWIKDIKNISRSAKEKFSKNVDRKRVAREMTHCVIFLVQDTELVQPIKVWLKQGFFVSGWWVRVTIILLVRKAFREQYSTWLIIKAGAFKSRRVWMLKLI